MVVVDGKPVRLQLCDTAGQVSWQRWGLVAGSANVSEPVLSEDLSGSACWFLHPVLLLLLTVPNLELRLSF